MQMFNAKSKFREIRKACPGQRESMYLLAEFIATEIKDEISPLDLLYAMADALEAIEHDCVRWGMFKRAYSKKAWEKAAVLAEFYRFPELVDQIASRGFAEEFRYKHARAYHRQLPNISTRGKLLGSFR